MAEIGFVIVDKVPGPADREAMYSNGEQSVGEKSSKIVAFNADKSKALLQIWLEPDEEIAARVYSRPQNAPGKWTKSNRQLYIAGQPVDPFIEIPENYIHK